MLKVKRTPIRVFWHVAMMGPWEQIVQRQLFSLRKSDLYDKTDSITLGIAGCLQSWEQKVRNCLHGDKIIFPQAPSLLAEYEWPTLQRLYAHAQTEDCRILYMHTKGVSKIGNKDVPIENQLSAHRSALNLEYANIHRHQDCLKQLETHDIAAKTWNPRTPCPHCPGNFWWTNSDYIKKLQHPTTHENRYGAEFWVGTGEPTAWDFGKLPIIYDTYLPEKYWKTIFNGIFQDMI